MSDINGEMKAAADYAIRSAKEKFGQEIDFSGNSISKLENLLEEAYQSFLNLPKDEKTNNAISRTANIWGSYLGEFMHQKWGGAWVLKGSDRIISIKNTEFSPIKFVYQKITDQPEYAVGKYLVEAEHKINPLPIPEKQSQNISENIKQAVEPNFINQPPKTPKSNKNLIYVLGGIGGILFVIFACIIGYAIIKLGGISIPGLQPAITLTSTVTPTLPSTFTFSPTISPSPTITKTPTKSPTPRPTKTAGPTNTPHPTSTPIYGTFNNPASIGMAIERYNEIDMLTGGKYPLKMSAEVIEVRRGEEANALDKSSLDLLDYQKPKEGQEYLAVKMKIDLLEDDPNQSTQISPYWHFTLRYDEGGTDIWSLNLLETLAEGYPPLSGETWLFFVVKQDSQPLLYFQPDLIVLEQLGYRRSGAYFSLAQP